MRPVAKRPTSWRARRVRPTSSVRTSQPPRQANRFRLPSLTEMVLGRARCLGPLADQFTCSLRPPHAPCMNRRSRLPHGPLPALHPNHATRSIRRSPSAPPGRFAPVPAEKPSSAVDEKHHSRRSCGPDVRRRSSSSNISVRPAWRPSVLSAHKSPFVDAPAKHRRQAARQLHPIRLRARNEKARVMLQTARSSKHEANAAFSAAKRNPHYKPSSSIVNHPGGPGAFPKPLPIMSLQKHARPTPLLRPRPDTSLTCPVEDRHPSPH